MPHDADARGGADALFLSPSCTGRAVLSQSPLSLMGSGSELVLPGIPGSGSSWGIPTARCRTTHWLHSSQMQQGLQGTDNHPKMSPAGCSREYSHVIPTSAVSWDSGDALCSCLNVSCGLLVEIQCLWMYQVFLCVSERGFGSWNLGWVLEAVLCSNGHNQCKMICSVCIHLLSPFSPMQTEFEQ